MLPFAITILVGSPQKTDIFFLVAGAAQLAAFLLATVVEGSVLPMAIDVAERSVGSLRAFCRQMARHVLLLTLPVTAALAAVVFLLLRTATLTPAQAASGRWLLLALAPLPTLVAVSSVYGAAHFSQNHYVLTTASQGLRSLGGLVGAFFATGDLGIVAIAIGLCVGETCRAATLALTLPPAVHEPILSQDQRTSRSVFLLSSTPLLAATLIVAVNPLVDKAVASRLGPGSVTVLELTEKLFYVPMTLLFSAVTVVSGVVWAKLGESEMDAVAADFWRVQRVGFGVSAAIAVVAAVVALRFNGWIVGVLNLGSQVPFAVVFGLYIAGLPFGLAQSLGGRLLVVMRCTSMLPLLAVVLVIFNFVADVVGAALLGVQGIAISSSLVRLVNAAAFMLLARRMFRRG